MDGRDLEDGLRREAAAVVAGDDAAVGRLVGLGLDLIEQGIRAALGSGQHQRGWQRVDAVEACNGFLEDKLCTNAEAFCQTLLGYDRVSAGLKRSAMNWTISQLRKRTQADIKLDGDKTRDAALQPEDESPLHLLLELEGDSAIADLRRELWVLPRTAGGGWVRRSGQAA